MKPTTVFSFGESSPTDQWYAKEDGGRVKCDEKTIDKLYWQWLISPTASRVNEDGCIIFSVKESPLSL